VVVVSWALRGLILLYKLLVSPLLPPRCRFLPTCSDYALEAVARHGALKGSWLAARRLLRCHPWGGSGYDPVPALHVHSLSSRSPCAGCSEPS
jgi:putative membrane protein insertion efficiency factor